jgi:hypothetical protein
MKIPKAFIYLYIITTQTGPKFYFGSTTRTLNQRAGHNYSGYKGSKKFYNCLRKYPNNIERFSIEINSVTKDELLEIEQYFLDLIKTKNGKFPKWSLNTAHKAGGGILFQTEEQHAKASVNGGGSAAKPINVWNSETGEIILEANSTCCKKLQEFLGISRSHISKLLNYKDYPKCSLAQRSVEGILVSLTYQDETLEQKIESSTRVFSDDLEKARRLNLINKVFIFYNNKTDETKTISNLSLIHI